MVTLKSLDSSRFEAKLNNLFTLHIMSDTDPCKSSWFSKLYVHVICLECNHVNHVMQHDVCVYLHFFLCRVLKRRGVCWGCYMTATIWWSRPSTACAHRPLARYGFFTHTHNILTILPGSDVWPGSAGFTCYNKLLQNITQQKAKASGAKSQFHYRGLLAAATQPWHLP